MKHAKVLTFDTLSGMKDNPIMSDHVSITYMSVNYPAHGGGGGY